MFITITAPRRGGRKGGNTVRRCARHLTTNDGTVEEAGMEEGTPPWGSGLQLGTRMLVLQLTQGTRTGRAFQAHMSENETG